MSLFKEQLKKYLAQIDLKGDLVLSIGSQNDDRNYFKSVNIKEWKTLDIDEAFKPDIIFNMNKPIQEDDGDLNLDHSFNENFDAVLALELWDYIYDPMTAHKNVYTLLKPGGLYIGSYGFIYPHHNPMYTDYLRYTDWAIKKLLTVNRFTDIQITPRVATAGRQHLSKFVGAEGMRLCKELGTYDWPIGYMVQARK